MENENVNVKLLDDAYKNVKMGNYAIDCLINKIEDENFANLISKQNEFYLSLIKKLDNFSQTTLYEPKDINAMLKTSSFVSINFKTLLNKETSHIAQMLIEGTTMGITTLTKQLNQSDGANSELESLANEIVGNQEEFVESLKTFL